VASETGESKRNTGISSSASAQSESLHNFYLLMAFIKQNSHYQTCHKTFIVLCMLVIHQVSVDRYLQNQTADLSGRIPGFY